MKKILFGIFLPLFVCCNLVDEQKEVLIEGSNPQIRYVGRTFAEEGQVSFDWSGTYLELNFEGEEISLLASDNVHSYYNCNIDGINKVIEIVGSDTLILLANELKSKVQHTLRLQKRSEGSQGLTTIQSFLIKGSEPKILPAPDKAKRHIEFIGDSYTCGYGVESTISDNFSGATENCDLAHGAIIARLFDADYNFVSHSGKGMVRNYGDPKTTSKGGTMNELIKQTFDTRKEPQWDYSTSPYTPDIVVIFLGINDYSTAPQPSIDEFSSGYKEMIHTLRTAYGDDLPILCIAPVTGAGKAKQAINKMKTELGDKNIYAIEHFDNFMANPKDLGAHYHPNVEGQRKVAMMAIPYISSITGWNIPRRVIE